MANKYERKYCSECGKETLHNFKCCCPCYCKRYYYKNHGAQKKRLLDKYFSEDWDYSKTYTQKVITAKRKNRVVLFSREEFGVWWKNTPKVCAYCGITESDWAKRRGGYGKSKRLTLDRVDNKKDYEINNIVWACLKCNTEKRNKKWKPRCFQEKKETSNETQARKSRIA
jgi:hypothetical protein